MNIALDVTRNMPSIQTMPHPPYKELLSTHRIHYYLFLNVKETHNIFLSMKNDLMMSNHWICGWKCHTY